MSSTVPPPQHRRTDPLVGAVVNGKFRVESLVASGGMGKVYRAEQIALGRVVALKVLHAQTESLDLSDDPQFKKRFFREASILAKLQHPNIVTVFDYGAIEGAENERYFMAMEFLSGQTLSRRISDHGAMTARDTIRTARQIARGLTEAHAHGIIHRDLKPSNVMIIAGRDGEEQVKIVDFGIVKVVGDESESEELTQEGSFIGSPKYMAPEQISRGGKIDARTDVYSLGIILYQCLTGSVPFDAASSIQTLMAHLNQEPQPIRERAPQSDVPDWLEMLVMACIEKAPEKRPQTMDVVARALADAEVEAAFTSGRMRPSVSTPMSTRSAGAVLPTARSGSLPEMSKATRTSGVTEQATTSSLRPEESDKTRTSPGVKKDVPAAPKSRVVPALIGAGLAVLVVAGFLALRRAPAPAESAALAPLPTASAIAPAPKRDFTLTIESTPGGADVREGDRVLGQTPLRLTIDNDGARLESRRFVVTKDAFAPYTLEQGPSDESVRLVATLVATPPAEPVAAVPTASAAPAPAHSAAKHPTSSPRATPPASSTGLDIRLSR